MNLKDTLEMLRTRGFTLKSDRYLGSRAENERVIASGEGAFVLLNMPCTVTFPKAKKYGDIEVWVSSWDSLRELEHEAAHPIFSGGLYTFMRIFAHGVPQDQYNGLGDIPEDPEQALD
ncbi:MAG: hypothetical protein R3A79_12740 [Nannocystaceae bacterium]